MQLFLDRFILDIPRLYIKQFPYAWIVFIALWTWPPNIGIIFFLIIILGIFMSWWQPTAWLRVTQTTYALHDGKFYVDRPTFPIRLTVRNILILLAVSALLALPLRVPLNLTFWQIVIIISGFMLMYQDSIFFGSPTIYVIATRGIGIYYAPGHVDYRLFIEFNEVAKIERCEFQNEQGWSHLARTPNSKDGLLLISKNPNGFSKRLGRIFIVPKNIETFLNQLPHALV